MVEGLAEFRRALRAAESGLSGRDLAKAIKAGGEPALREASALAPVGPTGGLSKGYKVRTRGNTGYLTSRVPYAAGADWGLHGKWSGFTKYGPQGERFAGRAVDTKADEIGEAMSEALRDLLTLAGWAKD